MNSEQKKMALHRFDTPEALAAALAEDFKSAVNLAAEEGKLLKVALSGGSTPKRFFKRLAEPPYRDGISWQTVHFFWGDERCVPPEDQDSNYGTAHELLFSLINFPEENVHRIHGEADPEGEAERYTAEIKTILPLQKDEFPHFDWILLGMGEDGHTASLFPGTDLGESQKICKVAVHPQSGQRRISLTLPVINAAKRVSFLITGGNKKEVFREIYDGAPGSGKYPAAHVKPVDGRLEWYVDDEAAAGI
jgi:6-phosphogluconolactonase